MERDFLQRKIAAAISKVAQLTAEHAVDASEGPFREAVDQLAVALEELRVADEELRVQHDQLLAARRESELERMRYRALFDTAPVGYVVTRLDGVITHANFEAMRLLAKEACFLLGKPLAVFIAGPDRRR